MKEIATLLLIGLALSLDAFSLTLSIGMIKEKKGIVKLLPIMIGVFHFFMPLLGNTIGYYIYSVVPIDINLFLGIILIAVAIEMLIESFQKEKDKKITTLFSIVLLSITVSLDSFTTGIGIQAITNHYYLAYLIFSCCSFLISYMGLVLGKYLKELIGKYAKVLGSLILFILGIVYICK